MSFNATVEFRHWWDAENSVMLNWRSVRQLLAGARIRRDVSASVYYTDPEDTIPRIVHASETQEMGLDDLCRGKVHIVHFDATNYAGARFLVALICSPGVCGMKVPPMDPPMWDYIAKQIGARPVTYLVLTYTTCNPYHEPGLLSNIQSGRLRVDTLCVNIQASHIFALLPLVRSASSSVRRLRLIFEHDSLDADPAFFRAIIYGSWIRDLALENECALTTLISRLGLVKHQLIMLRHAADVKKTCAVGRLPVELVRSLAAFLLDFKV